MERYCLEKMAHEKVSNGRHLILDLYDCDKELLDDYEGLCVLLKEALDIAEANVLRVIGEKFQPQGVTILALLAESHCSIHTWPEIGYCAIDLYTCGSTTKTHAGANYLTTSLKAHKVNEQELTRYAFAVVK